jgi:hypothetical protein
LWGFKPVYVRVLRLDFNLNEFYQNAFKIHGVIINFEPQTSLSATLK